MRLMVEDRTFIIQNVFNATSNYCLQRTNEGMCLSAHFVKHHSLQQQWDITVSAAPQGEAVQRGGIYLHGTLHREHWLCLVSYFYRGAWMKSSSMSRTGNQHVHPTALLLLFYLISVCTFRYVESPTVLPCGTKVWLRHADVVLYTFKYLVFERANLFMKRVRTDLSGVRKSHGAT